MRIGTAEFRRVARGFTLIELVTVMAVLAVLVALSAPSFKEYFEKQRLRGAADDVISLLSTARAEAIKRERDVNVTSSGGGGTDWCFGANAAADPTLGNPVGAATACNCKTNAALCLVGAEQLVVKGDAYPGVTIDAIDDAVTFDRKLGALSTLGTTTLTLTSDSGTFALRVDVTALGHAHACVPTGQAFVSGYPSCAP